MRFYKQQTPSSRLVSFNFHVIHLKQHHLFVVLSIQCLIQSMTDALVNLHWCQFVAAAPELLWNCSGLYLIISWEWMKLLPSRPIEFEFKLTWNWSETALKLLLIDLIISWKRTELLPLRLIKIKLKLTWNWPKTALKWLLIVIWIAPKLLWNCSLTGRRNRFR